MLKSNNIVIGIVGTANTGKTTLINDIVSSEMNSERDKDLQWTLFGKDYRKIIEEKNLKINRNGNEECQKVIHETLLQNIIDATNEPFLKRIIMDRTILDSFTYTYWHYRYGKNDISEDALSLMWRQVVRFSRLYTKILYIPMEYCSDIKVVDDKFRDTDTLYRKQIDAIFKIEYMTLLKHGINMDVIYGNRNVRVDKFFSIEKKTMMENPNIDDFDNCVIEFSNCFLK